MEVRYVYALRLFLHAFTSGLTKYKHFARLLASQTDLVSTIFFEFTRLSTNRGEKCLKLALKKTLNCNIGNPWPGVMSHFGRCRHT